jgi:hypothetical protein
VHPPPWSLHANRALVTTEHQPAPATAEAAVGSGRCRGVKHQAESVMATIVACSTLLYAHPAPPGPTAPHNPSGASFVTQTTTWAAGARGWGPAKPHSPTGPASRTASPTPSGSAPVLRCVEHPRGTAEPHQRGRRSSFARQAQPLSLPHARPPVPAFERARGLGLTQGRS